VHVGADAGGAHHPVEPAEGRDHVGEHQLGRRLVGYVELGCPHQGLPGEPVAGPCEPDRVVVENADLPAGRDQPFDTGKPDAGGASGDDRGTAAGGDGGRLRGVGCCGAVGVLTRRGLFDRGLRHVVSLFLAACPRAADHGVKSPEMAR